MENVVYILGAGFSAPLGLPVMSNFLSKSKDMYFNTDGEYDYFDEVFKLIERMSYIKNYYNSNLFNIEEILSILEMRNFLNDDQDKKMFINYISDVIEYYTPTINSRSLPDKNFHHAIMGSKDKIHNTYGNFIVSIFNLIFKNEGVKSYKTNSDSNYNYSIISLNYDRVIENYVDHLSKVYDPKDDLKIITSLEEYNNSPSQLPLCKLHGCVELGNIIPPTWNKTSNDKLLKTWQLADKLLSEANHIRILGYSLPVTDSYIIYLLKSSILDCDHLKSIDVITLDKNKQTKSNYDQFIDFANYRFKNANIVDYFQMIKEVLTEGDLLARSDRYNYNFLERSHNKFMNEY
ncbi:SIR2-like protein [Halanaerobium saccharolyticum]|uniref:SIR2-like protein n=1 Tax=Halanaerobium saccharolyticum TaxID=43595 RepID=A0A4R7YL61_9FIRM|nr:SIR2 family protein [Halanaerobium saccharolyticum]RAK04008.1 SIR2-like protein [Halanaerobium saccharolyticum]TDV97349.1 SIR2-like protein [Halanaerobium saccharolyticum]TDX49166.1 SIR2-like protein [Halanaerobium saccharolyticum]